MAKPTILIIGTLDTKGPELSYLHDSILQGGPWGIAVLDVGTGAPSPETAISIPSGTIFRPDFQHDSKVSRGEAIQKVIEAAIPVAEALVSDSKIHGVISAGGSCNTSIASTIMRKVCPIGLPKLMVTTMASGDIQHYIEETDITMMPSVVDVAGLNTVLRQILDNAAGAIVGMTSAYFLRLQKAKVESQQRNGNSITKPKRIAITMFGVTTPCVDRIRHLLCDKSKYEVYIFHATGAGGNAMERLILEDQIDGLIDLTTTEVADEIVGGNLSAGPNRLEAAAKKGIPQVVSVGACDMVNFGPPDTVPSKFREQNRKFVEHNPSVTLMRTNQEECKMIGEFIATNVRSGKAKEKVKVLLPVGGLSMLDREGGDFWDAEVDEILFTTLEDRLDGSGVRCERVEGNVNDEAFAQRLVDELLVLMK